MKMIVKSLTKLAVAGALASVALMPFSAASAQTAAPRALVSLYHAATGHQEALLRWLADQDRVGCRGRVAPGQVYAHTDGDSWDYMVINPVTTAAQDDALDAAAKKLGLPSGPRAGLEFRKNIQSHTDTFTVGPLTTSNWRDSARSARGPPNGPGEPAGPLPLAPHDQGGIFAASGVKYSLAPYILGRALNLCRPNFGFATRNPGPG